MVMEGRFLKKVILTACFVFMFCIVTNAKDRDFGITGDLEIEINTKGSYQGFDVDSLMRIEGGLDYIKAKDNLKLFGNTHMYNNGEEVIEPYDYEMYVTKDVISGIEAMESEANVLEGAGTGYYDVFMKKMDTEGNIVWDLDILEKSEVSGLYLNYDTVVNYIKKLFKKDEGAVKFSELKQGLNDLIGKESDIASSVGEYEELLGDFNINYKVNHKKDLLDKIEISIDGIDPTEPLKAVIPELENFSADLAKANLTIKFKYKDLDASVPQDVEEEGKTRYQSNILSYIDDILETEDEK